MTHLSDTALGHAVDQWVHTTQGLSDTELDTAWVWRAHDEEGVRFAFFRVFEELRTLAASLAAQRTLPITAAQRAMMQYHTAWRDLQAVLIGVSEDVMDQEPAEGEWSLRRIFGHMFVTPRMFYCQSIHALREAEAGRKIEQPMSEDEIVAFLGHGWEEYDTMMGGTRAQILADYAAMHARILSDMAQVSDERLTTPSLWWEGYEVPVQFRLHRFESHMRQHTVQIEKTLDKLGLAPSESKRLNRHIFNAFAECEGVQLGASGFGDAQMDATAETIRDLAGQIAIAVS